MSRPRIGIDVGGTFTDLVSIDADGVTVIAKSPSTPEDQSVGVLAGLEELAGHHGCDLRALLGRTERIVHGTTAATNALLERKSARVALLITEGHRDVLEMREGLKGDRYDLRRPPPAPLVPRSLRLGVRERVGPDSAVLTPPRRRLPRRGQCDHARQHRDAAQRRRPRLGGDHARKAADDAEHAGLLTAGGDGRRGHRKEDSEMADDGDVPLRSDLRAACEAGRWSGCVGTKLLSETDEVRIWHLHIPVGVRIPWHRHVLDHFWTALSEGRSRNFFEDGGTSEHTLSRGQTVHRRFAPGEYMLHWVENIGETDLEFMTVEFLAGSNAPLSLAEDVRRAIR